MKNSPSGAGKLGRYKKYSMDGMVLIADSGSTKTDWAVVGREGTRLRVSTQGINPYMLSVSQIEQKLSAELLPALEGISCSHVAFYGAGCRGGEALAVKGVLERIWSEAVVNVESDLLGAAHALCGSEEGIACIMGTGSNSCLYDGEKVVQNVPCLGFILGDEGSGAVLGRLLLGQIVKGNMPEEVCEAVRRLCPGGVDEMLERVYKQPFPNRFLASFVPVLHEFRHLAEVRTLLVDEFYRFFVRNTRHYGRPDLPVNFVGSVAFHFEEELSVAAERSGQKLGTVLKNPLEGLCRRYKTLLS